MVAGQTGIILKDNTQALIAGTATGGSSTTLIDTSKDFVALGVAVGDRVVVWDHASLAPLSRSAVVAPILATTLTFGDIGAAISSGTRYMVVRNSFVIVRGSASIRHEHRLPVQPIPGFAGDKVQSLARKSRVVTVDRGTIYRGDLASASRDAAHVTEAQQLRTWLDAGTELRLDTLTEAALRVKFSWLEVHEQAAAKGFPVSYQLVEVV